MLAQIGFLIMGWRKVGFLLLLALMAVVPFISALQADFVEWDDDINVTENPKIHGVDWGNVRWMFGTADRAMRYKPVNWLAWALIYQAQGLRPLGFHLANLLFHAANTVLLFLILRCMLFLSQENRGGGQNSVPAEVGAVIGALLWAWHPLRVEPVAWVTGLPYNLALFFMLLSWAAYLLACRVGEPNRWSCYWLSVGAYILAVLSYPIVLFFVAILMAMDIAVLRRFSGGQDRWFSPEVRRVWIEKIPYCLVAGIALAITLVGRINPDGQVGYQTPATLAEFGIGPRVMQAFYVWAYYVWKPLVPTDLAIVYPTLIRFNPASYPFVLSLSGVLLTTLVLFLRWRGSGLLTLWITYLVVTIPVLGVTETPHFPSDRYGHLPTIAWSVLGAYGIALIWKEVSPRKLVLCIGAGMILLFGLFSYWQTAVWRNSVTLFEATVESLGDSPYCGDFAWRLGRLHALAGDVERAGLWFDRYRKSRLENLSGHRSAAVFYLGRMDLENALYHADKALGLDRHDTIAFNTLAAIAGQRGDWARARELYEASLGVEARQPAMWEKLAEALERLGKGEEAARARARGRNLGGAGGK